MKHIVSFLCVLMLVFATSCSTTRKTAKLEAQTQISAAVSSNAHTQQTASDAILQRVTETDLSNIVIDFTKVEYADGTSDIKTTEAQTETPMPKQHDREQTEPPNAKQNNVKAVTSGRVTINNDKKRQEDTGAQHSEVTNSDTSQKADVSQKSEAEAQTKEQPTHSLFWLGLTIGAIAVITFVSFVIYAYRRIKKQQKIFKQ